MHLRIAYFVVFGFVSLWYLVDRVLSRTIYAAAIRAHPRIFCDGEVVVRGLPLIDIHEGASVRIGAGVVLGSRNRGYHVGMFSPVKLMADRSGAVIAIGKDSRLHGVCIHAYSSVAIGSRCLIAGNTQIMDCSGHLLCEDDVARRVNSVGVAKPVVIEDDVWICTGSIVLPGVRIGRGAVVGANSVVHRDVPAFALVSGNPASVVKLFQ